MDGVDAERSRIHPMTDFVDLMLENIRFIWELENVTTKQLITDSTNSSRKQPTSTSEHPNQMSQFSPNGANDEPLSMFETQTQQERTFLLFHRHTWNLPNTNIHHPEY